MVMVAMAIVPPPKAATLQQGAQKSRATAQAAGQKQTQTQAQTQTQTPQHARLTVPATPPSSAQTPPPSPPPLLVLVLLGRGGVPLSLLPMLVVW